MSATPLAVWAADLRAGLLDKTPDQHRYVFAYDQAARSPDAQVSLTMPVRLESWLSRDLHPIFQMNLPEGALLEAIRRAIAKLVGEDDLTILRVTGGNQIGRNRFSLPGIWHPGIVESAESLDDLLSYPDTEELFHDLVANMHSVPVYPACNRKSCWMQLSGEALLWVVISLNHGERIIRSWRQMSTSA